MASSKQFKASIVLGGTVAGSLKTAFGTTEGGLKRIGATVQALTNRQRLLGNAIQTFGRQGRNVDRLRDSYSRVTRQVDRLSHAQRRLNAMEQRSIHNREKLDALVGKLPGGHMIGTLATGAGVLAGLHAYEKINDAEVDLRVALMDKSGGVPKAFEKIRQEAIGLHNILPGTLADFHNVAVALKQNGTSADVIANGGLEAAAKLGVVMKIPVESAAEMTAKLRESFQLSEHELGKMADLSQRARFGFGLKPEDLLLGAKYYGGKLGGLGLTGADNVRKIYALQGQAAQSGMDGSTFGTNFGAMLSRVGMLNVRMKRHSQVMKNADAILSKYKIHLEFFDKHGKFEGIDNLVAQLGKLKALSQQERSQVLTTLFGEEGGRPAELIARKGLAGYRSSLEAMDEQASMEQRVNELTRSLTVRMQALKGSVETAVGMAFEPLGKSLADLAERANVFIAHTAMPWIESHQKLFSVVTKVAAGLFILRAGIIATRVAFYLMQGGVIGALVQLWKFRAGTILASELGPLAKGIRMVGMAFRWLGSTILASPIFWVAAAIGLVAVEIYRHWDGVKSFFGTLWADLKRIFGDAIGIITGVMTGDFSLVIKSVKDLFSGLGTFVSDIFDGISKGLATMVDDALKAVGLVDEKRREMEVGKKRAAAEEQSRESALKIGAKMALVGGSGSLPALWALFKANRSFQEGNNKAAAGSSTGMPPMATARGASVAPPVTQQNVFHITQHPGEDGEALARRVSKHIDRLQGVAIRGQLIDGVGI